MQVNEATGEVGVTLGEVKFRLHAGMERLAEFQAASGVAGIEALDLLLQKGDARAIYHGLRCLSVPRPPETLDTMLLLPVIGDAIKALRATLVAGVPKPREGDDRGNAEAAAT